MKFEQVFHADVMERVAMTPEPAGQKFPFGTRVRIGRLSATMSHFPSLVNATVEYTYAHAYGGDDVTSYSLNVDGQGSTSWYHENQLTEITEVPE